MADAVKTTPSVLIGGNVSGEPAFGAYSAEDGMNFTRDVTKRVPYSMLEKTGRVNPSAHEVFDPNKRWLRELAITSADKLDFQKAWETDNFRRQKSEHEWRDTYGGKLAIRTFSRGILGSVFFAAGQHMAGSALKNYAYDPHDASKNSAIHNPLELVARILDKTIGQGIYKAVFHLSSGDKAAKAKNAVTFRYTNQWEGYGYKPNGEKVMGRSYGHEGLGITFDFGLASLGDWFGREIAGLIDPNTEKKWMKDGHIEVPQMLKALFKSVWTGVTKAMGEDYFAMAAGYPYVVRGTRNLITKFSPGFEHDSDRWANGGSFKIDDQGKIIGNYQLEGMLDLGARFTIYNMFTKVFRDGYDRAASSLKHFWDGDRTIHMPHFDQVPTPANLLEKVGDGIATSANYLARTIIKVALIMVPSSAVFAFIRSAQSKDIGLAINPDKGPVGVFVEKNGKKEWTPIFTNGAAKSEGKRSEFYLSENTAYSYKDGSKAQFSAFAPDKTKGYEKRFDAYGQTTESTKWHDRITNPVGRFCNSSGKILTELVKPAARFFGGKKVDIGNVSKHTERFVDATFAYTPYFMAKTDLMSTMYDTPRMNMAIDRFLKGIVRFNFKEMKAGLGEIAHAMLGRPFADPAREAEAQKKMQTYTNQLWSNQDEIIAKEREEEYRDRMDAMLSLGKPIPIDDLYRPSFTDKVGRRPQIKPQDISQVTALKNRLGIGAAPDDSAELQNDTRSAQAVKDALSKASGGSFAQRAVREFNNSNSSQGQTVN